MTPQPPAAVSSTIRLKQGAAVWCEVDGETVVLDVAAAEYLSANPTGSLLWRAMAAGTTVGQLADELADAYGIDAAVARRSVDQFVEACRRRGFIDG